MPRRRKKKEQELDAADLRAALIGYEAEKENIERLIIELKRELKVRSLKNWPAASPRGWGSFRKPKGKLWAFRYRRLGIEPTRPWKDPKPKPKPPSKGNTAL